jgi:hypothetical protein
VGCGGPDANSASLGGLGYDGTMLEEISRGDVRKKSEDPIYYANSGSECLQTIVQSAGRASYPSLKTGGPAEP